MYMNIIATQMFFVTMKYKIVFEECYLIYTP